MWVRGLKHLGIHINNIGVIVAPRVGAWIETLLSTPANGRVGSHPVWVRGLKHGLLRFATMPYRVAPRVGAWIETLVD